MAITISGAGITSAQIQADGIDGSKIADDAVDSEHIAAGGVDDAHIADLAATKLTGTIADARFPATLPAISGANLTNVAPTKSTVEALGIDVPAANLTGTVASARFPATLPAASGVNLTAINATNLGSGTVPTARLGSGSADNTKFLRGDGSWQVVSIPKLDSPVISGTLAVLDGGNVSHTISNWSDDISYTITPTNCTVGSVNSSGVFVVTHTSGAPSYTIVATTASLGLDDSATVTKNITMQLTAPTISSPADNEEDTNVVYTITSTTTADDKLILDFGASTFNFGSVSVGSASKVGNTVECTGFTTNNPAVTVQFTAEATYSVTAKSVHIAGTYTTSANSSADSITIVNGPSSSGGGASNFTWGSYTIHKFISSGTFNTGDKTSFDILVVAGGGAGGDGVKAGGGGAGGVIYTAGQSLTGGTDYTITVGAGGTESGGSYTAAENSSVASVIVATGGGHGGDADDDPSNGGSGGGAAARNPHVSPPTDTGGGSGTSGQGNAGASYSQYWGGAGGGGKGSAGSTKNGGSGADYSSYFGTSNIPGSGVVGAGGGGAAGNNKYSGTGGSGIGGNGNSWEHDDNAAPRPPVANTGSGGGGAADIHGNASDINGADGLVLIRYTT